jgi:hypothetical protein
MFLYFSVLTRVLEDKKKGQTQKFGFVPWGGEDRHPIELILCRFGSFIASEF